MYRSIELKGEREQKSNPPEQLLVTGTLTCNLIYFAMATALHESSTVRRYYCIPGSAKSCPMALLAADAEGEDGRH